MRAAESGLRLATKELHHAAEAHPIGASMADGTMRPEWWAEWLQALFVIHCALDVHLPPDLGRSDALAADITAMATQYDCHGADSDAAAGFARQLHYGYGIHGAAYVFTGAHLMGGAITERAIGQRLPCAHLRWLDRAAAIAAWQTYRSDTSREKEARAAFRCVLDILDEILSRHPATT